jgi:fumarate reductase flavoprotein subunit
VIDRVETDILILGAGGAGLCAALHAADRSPSLSVTLVVKGLLGRAGCTRMVQGGYNAVLTEPDSLDAHFLDTLAGGGWINDQELVWTLVVEAPARVLELESRYGCLFDRTPEGRIHQKPFAGQTHDRTIHKGDLTGIEIMNRLSEQVLRRDNVRALEECRGGGRPPPPPRPPTGSARSSSTRNRRSRPQARRLRGGSGCGAGATS